MGKMRGFASRRPLLFVILAIVSTLVMANLAGALVVVLFRVDQTDPMLAAIAELTATLFLVFLLWRFGWLKAAGVAAFGRWKGWMVALVLLVYYLLELTYSFFGEFSFSVPTAAVSGLRVPSVFIGGMWEEILFRGGLVCAGECVGYDQERSPESRGHLIRSLWAASFAQCNWRRSE